MSIIETLKYSDQHKKLLDNVLFDKLMLDGELEVKEEVDGEDFIKSYKAIREKNDLGVFVLPIRLEGKYDFHALVDTGSNINVMPYRIYEALGRDQVKPIRHKIIMLDHSKAEPVGRLMDVLCQVGVTMILASFLLLDISIDRDVSIVMGRSFLHTCGAIMNTIKGTTSTFDVIVHQKFYVANVRNAHEESNSDDDEECCLKRDDIGKLIYRPNHAKYLSCDNSMDKALALQEALNPFKKIYVWKKVVAFLGALPVPLQLAEWIPDRSGNFAKENGDGKWNTKIRFVDPYGNIFEQGYETKVTDRKIS
ncbi:agenet domain-containing protein [Tanacetum coccineum]